MNITTRTYYNTCIEDLERMLKIKCLIKENENLLLEKLNKDLSLDGILNTYNYDVLLYVNCGDVTIDVCCVLKTYKDEIYEIQVLYNDKFALQDIIYKTCYRKEY